VYAGKPSDRAMFSKGVMSWVYPRVLKNEKLWNDWLFRSMNSPFIEVDGLLT